MNRIRKLNYKNKNEGKNKNILKKKSLKEINLRLIS